MELSEADRQDIIISLMAARQAAMKSMLWGVAFILAGLVITGMTYASAEPGESYAVFWGLPAFGAYRFLRGWYYYVRPHKLLA